MGTTYLLGLGYGIEIPNSLIEAEAEKYGDEWDGAYEFIDSLLGWTKGDKYPDLDYIDASAYGEGYAFAVVLKNTKKTSYNFELISVEPVWGVLDATPIYQFFDEEFDVGRAEVGSPAWTAAMYVG